jgi:transcriptional regulator with XRE-family HTH domain
MTGYEFYRRRLHAGLTRKQLADRLGVSANTVRRWERDEHRIPRAVMMVMREMAHSMLTGAAGNPTPHP